MSEGAAEAKRQKTVEFVERNGGSGRITAAEIALRLNIGRQAVYTMLKQGFIPGLRIGRRWIITRHAYQQWERTCGMQPGAGLVAQPEVTVVH
jgi:excisionase family DNA binding protein